MKETAERISISPMWGKRKAILYELGSLGAFVAQVMCNPPSSMQFNKIAKELLDEIEDEIGEIYSIKDPNGNKGTLRYAIWSEVMICPKCKHQSTYWENTVTRYPLNISSAFHCPNCGHHDEIVNIGRVQENVFDSLLNRKQLRKKRVLVWLYGKTGKNTWDREPTASDIRQLKIKSDKFSFGEVPVHEMNWGILHRKGYHTGITHLHHFYTDRNLIVFSRLWEKATSYPSKFGDALKLLLLSYNASHSTLMSRVVLKKKSTNFVITGAQSGVLYISNLPVEKNIIDGIKRKITTFTASFKLVENSKSSVEVFNQSSTKLSLPESSVDYIFTDPPFGDYIPYSEINQINEAWLGQLTNNKEEVIVNKAQKKNTEEYALLMKQVFAEANKALKPDGLMNLVFHSAKSEIWQALVNAFQETGFMVSMSSILDKVQGSFKQVTSTVKVQGDPLILLRKANKKVDGEVVNGYEDDFAVIKGIVENAYRDASSADERTPERLFSRYVTACLESGIPVSKNARQFYKTIQESTLQFKQA
ncbi:MAG: DNA methylase, partial [Patescibacteria group bacterium]|nr:DNA methylase [Patescibacteria group bacterium]